jgi:DNA-binding cell septation regulator SpoVG
VNLKPAKPLGILWALYGCWSRSTDRTLKEVVTMQVTEVEIVFVKPKDGLIAFASVVLDDQLYLSGIAVHSKLVDSDYRLTYPTRKIGDTQFSLFHPIRKPVGLAIERAIVEKLKNVMSKRDAGHGRIDAGPASL